MKARALQPTSNISPADAARELLARRRARRSMAGFLEYIEAPPPSAHHSYIMEALDAVVSGECTRLMIFLPPGAGKSSLASVWFPAYYLGKVTAGRIIAASHTAELAQTFGRRVRNLVGSQRWTALFGGGLAHDMRSVAHWSTSYGGEYYAVGIGGSATGRRANILLIDDPLRGREDADSETIRNKTWEAYVADLRTRLLPGGAIIMMLTRWHFDDPPGRILPEDYDFRSGVIDARDGERWRVISIPAIAGDDDVLGRAPGEHLWPEYWPQSFLDQERISQGPRNWASLYQQRPAPEEGNFFMRDWIRYYDEPPKHLQVYLASDYAVTEGEGDYTVHLVAGVDPDDNIYLLDIWRQQATSDAWIEALLDLAVQYKPLCGFEEQGQIIKSVGPLLNLRMKERRAYYVRWLFTSTADKATRAQSIRGRMAMGKVYFPQKAPWLSDLVSELMTFPAGRNDDQVDALSLLGRALAQLVGGKVQSEEKQKKPGTTFLQAVQSNARRGGVSGRV